MEVFQETRRVDMEVEEQEGQEDMKCVCGGPLTLTLDKASPQGSYRCTCLCHKKK